MRYQYYIYIHIQCVSLCNTLFNQDIACPKTLLHFYCNCILRIRDPFALVQAHWNEIPLVRGVEMLSPMTPAVTPHVNHEASFYVLCILVPSTILAQGQ